MTAVKIFIGPDRNAYIIPHYLLSEAKREKYELSAQKFSEKWSDYLHTKVCESVSLYTGSFRLNMDELKSISPQSVGIQTWVFSKHNETFRLSCDPSAQVSWTLSSDVFGSMNLSGVTSLEDAIDAARVRIVQAASEQMLRLKNFTV